MNFLSSSRHMTVRFTSRVLLVCKFFHCFQFVGENYAFAGFWPNRGLGGGRVAVEGELW